MLIIVFFSKTRLLSGVNVWNVSFGEISNLKFKIQELQMKSQDTRNTRKKNSLRRMRSHSGPFKIKTPINSTPLFFICVNLRHLRILAV